MLARMCAYIIYYISFFVYNEGSSKSCPSFLTLKFFLKSTRPSLPLKKVLSKTHQSSLTLKGGSTAFPKPLSPQGTGDVPTALLGAQTATLYGWRTIRGLRQFFMRDGTAGRRLAKKWLCGMGLQTRWMAHCVIC